MKKEKKDLLEHKGLTSEQVVANRQKYGTNVLTPPEKTPWWKLYLEKFEDPIIRILIIAALVSIGIGAVEGSYVESIGIVIAIFLATTLAFMNEFKAGKEFDALNQVRDDEPVKVLRDGAYTTVPKRDVVYGDVVLIEIGEEIPADGIVLESVSLQVNESSLTGESVPVAKHPRDSEHHSATKEHAYSSDKVLRGTLVADGHGVILVMAVGDSTEIGHTARAASEETGKKTPLTIQLERLSKIIGVIGFGVSGLTFASLLVRGVSIGELNLNPSQWYVIVTTLLFSLVAFYRVWVPIFFDFLDLIGKHRNFPLWLEDNSLLAWIKGLGVGILFEGFLLGIGILTNIISPIASEWMTMQIAEEFLKFFMISVTIIVVAVPEGLAMSVTLSLAYSVRKMTATNNLVRKMHAVETISAATVICSDKTGTLTLNEMQVKEINFPMLKYPSLKKDDLYYTDKILIEAISSNSTANLSFDDGKAKVLGNPTEGALILWLNEHGINYDQYRQQFRYLNQWTFTTERKFMGTYGVSDINSKHVLYIKGAPEIILKRCKNILTPEGLVPIENYTEEINNKLKDYQARAMRTLAFAIMENEISFEGKKLEDISHEMIWLGFVAIMDPVRPEVPPSVEACLKAGIQVKIVTGDTPGTAKEIAKQIGLWKPEDKEEETLIIGPEFEKLSDEEAANRALKIKVMARARPLDKLRLVKLLQTKNQVVAVTGDGTNDAPALNYADVGLSMGKTGTSVAKEASDIILLDDSFRSIVNAVMWGRSLYQNIQKFLLFQLIINVIAMVTVLAGPFLGIKLTLTVIQMIWVNLIMDTFAALALATQPPTWTVMQKPPRKPGDFIITPPIAKRIFASAALFLVVLIGTIFYFQSDSVVTEYELSIFFTLFVMLQFWNLLNAKTLGTNHSAIHKFRQNKALPLILGLIIVMQYIIVEFGGKVFRTVPLSTGDWLWLIFGTSFVLWFGELERYIRRKKEAVASTV